MYQSIHQTSSSASVQCLCTLAGVPRCGYYRYRAHDDGSSVSDPLGEEIPRICAHYPCYGYRRVTEELHRSGYQVNHKRVRIIMRKNNLHCRTKKRWIRTTDSRHGFRVYPNLAETITVVRVNQLWVADITYIRLVRGFVYLAVVLDAFSRRVVGWAISAHVDTRLSVAALTMALQSRAVCPGLIHHSDQGVQYASGEYVNLLASKNVMISMSRKGNPYDNAIAESFMKTLKAEEVYLNEYENLYDAKNNIDHFIDTVYNQKRLHSSLGYKPPVEFEADSVTQVP